MKKLSLIVILGLFLISCKKETVPPPPPKYKVALVEFRLDMTDADESAVIEQENGDLKQTYYNLRVGLNRVEYTADNIPNVGIRLYFKDKDNNLSFKELIVLP